MKPLACGSKSLMTAEITDGSKSSMTWCFRTWAVESVEEISWGRHRIGRRWQQPAHLRELFARDAAGAVPVEDLERAPQPRRPGAQPRLVQPTNMIEAPWLVNGGHGASFKQRTCTASMIIFLAPATSTPLIIDVTALSDGCPGAKNARNSSWEIVPVS
jgi:hypothetical protein